jgi:methylated-DNA-[protein]-cysteine S-methyltransferase
LRGGVFTLCNTMPDSTYFTKIVESPVGSLTLVASKSRLVAILWANDKPGRIKLGPMVAGDNEPILLKTQKQLSEYFSGERTQFELELEFAGTPFQKQVWNALLSIPYGEIRSYQQIATQIGNPKACRAVGAANGKNPLSIIAPCHRVVGASGALTGFAGGVQVKAFLLDLEKKIARQQDRSAGLLLK